jgi:hypothetical protein
MDNEQDNETEIDLEELRSMEIDSVFYGALVNIMSNDLPSSIALVTVLLEKLKAKEPLETDTAVDVLLAVVGDLEDSNYFEEREAMGGFDGPESYSEGPEEYGIEFEIKTVQDDDPKKRLN